MAIPYPMVEAWQEKERFDHENRNVKYHVQQGQKYHASLWRQGLLTHCTWPWKQCKAYHGF